jgi:hypothetical protein
VPEDVLARLLSLSGAKPDDRWKTGYLKPYKKLVVDVTASKAGLDKALAGNEGKVPGNRLRNHHYEHRNSAPALVEKIDEASAYLSERRNE